MKWFTNLKIRVKLILCFVLLAMLTGIVGGVGITNMNTLNKASNNMYNYNFISAQSLARIQVSLQDVRANQILAVYEKNPTTLKDRLDLINQLAEHNNGQLAIYEGKIQSEEERKLYNNVMSALSKYRDIRNANLELVKQGEYDQALVELSAVTEARL